MEFEELHIQVMNWSTSNPNVKSKEQAWGMMNEIINVQIHHQYRYVLTETEILKNISQD